MNPYLEKHCDKFFIIDVTFLCFMLSPIKYKTLALCQICCGLNWKKGRNIKPSRSKSASLINSLMSYNQFSHNSILIWELTCVSSGDNFSPKVWSTWVRSGTVMKPWPSLSKTRNASRISSSISLSWISLKSSFCYFSWFSYLTWSWAKQIHWN